MLSTSDAEKLLDLGLSKGGDFAELFFETKTTNNIVLDEEKIKDVSSGDSQGIGIRVLKGDEIGYAYSDNLSFETLKESALTAATIAKGKAVQHTLKFEKTSPTRDVPIKKLPESIPASDKVDIVKKVNESARRYDSRVKEVKVRYFDMTRKFAVYNSEGLFIEDSEVHTMLQVQTLAIEKNKRHTGISGCGGYIGYELYDQFTPSSIGTESAEMAVKMLDARPAPAGRMPVVISAGNAVIFHEAIGHGLEADIVQKGRSIYANRIGEKVASELVTIVDDPTIPYKGGSIKIDDEGTEAKRTVLIENGVLKSYMYDRITAKRDNAPLTGNGRRESFKHYPIPRMTNTCLLNRDMTEDEIIKSVRFGLYVKQINGGQVNTASGDFTFAVLEAYLIEDGKITAPVREASLIGNGIEILKNIDMVAGNFAFGKRSGMCGKGQMVFVGDAQPTIRVSEMTVGGTEKR